MTDLAVLPWADKDAAHLIAKERAKARPKTKEQFEAIKKRINEWEERVDKIPDKQWKVMRKEQDIDALKKSK